MNAVKRNMGPHSGKYEANSFNRGIDSKTLAEVI
jgi:hypothetical protein